MNPTTRFVRRVQCQFVNHDVGEIRGFSCSCKRCNKGWHPETYFAGPQGQAWTIRNVAVQVWRYFFAAY